jgi:hypothetical protein
MTCPFRKSYPDVTVVQPGQDWDGDDGTGTLDRPTQRRILAQSQVRADLIVVRRISRIVHRQSPGGGGEQISINLRAVLSFEAFGRFL